MDDFLKSLRQEKTHMVAEVDTAVGQSTIGCHYARALNTHYHEQRLQYCKDAGYGGYSVKPLDLLSLARKSANDGKVESTSIARIDDKSRADFYKYNIGINTKTGTTHMPQLERARHRHKLTTREAVIAESGSSSSEEEEDDPPTTLAHIRNVSKAAGIATGRVAINLATGAVVKESRGKPTRRGLSLPTAVMEKQRQMLMLPSFAMRVKERPLELGQHAQLSHQDSYRSKPSMVNLEHSDSSLPPTGKKSVTISPEPPQLQGSRSKATDSATSLTEGEKGDGSRNLATMRSVNFSISRPEIFAPPPGYMSNTKASSAVASCNGLTQSQASALGRSISRSLKTAASIARRADLRSAQVAASSALAGANDAKKPPSTAPPVEQSPRYPRASRTHATRVKTAVGKTADPDTPRDKSASPLPDTPAHTHLGCIGRVLAEAREYNQALERQPSRKPSRQIQDEQSLRRQMTIRTLARQMSGVALGKGGAQTTYKALRKAMRREAKYLTSLEEAWAKRAAQPSDAPDWDVKFVHAESGKAPKRFAEDEQRYWGAQTIKRPMVPRQMHRVHSNRMIADVRSEEVKYHEASKVKRVLLPSVM